MTIWRPLSERKRVDHADYDGPHSGVPPWLAPSLWTWAGHRLHYRDFLDNVRVDVDLLRELERVLHISLVGSEYRLSTLQEVVTNSEDMFLDVVDYLCSRVRGDLSPLAQLETALVQAGSVWTVATIGDRPGLQERIDETTLSAAAKVMSENDRSATHLRSAWTAVYGRTPDPTGGYREAVRAVEVLACKVVVPKDAKATLGKVIGQLKAHPTSWQVVLHDPSSDHVDRLIGMLELLWTSQVDRHGTHDESVPLNVSKPEAEAALHLAVVLVDWFRRGVVRPA